VTALLRRLWADPPIRRAIVLWAAFCALGYVVISVGFVAMTDLNPSGDAIALGLNLLVAVLAFIVYVGATIGIIILVRSRRTGRG
jgi:hypothetical protein